jgi:hypothetical protein
MAREDADLAALLRDFEPLPAALFSTEVAADSVGADSGDNKYANRPELNTRVSGAILPSADDGGRRARYRARARNELLYLREVAEELERELEGCKLRMSGLRASGEATQLQTSTQAVIWKALAARQRLERQHAEAENARLRALLENQVWFAAQLQSMMHQRVSGVSLNVTLGPQRVGVGSPDASILESYLGEMDSLRSMTDDILGQSGINLRPESPHRFTRIPHRAKMACGGDPEAGGYVEFLDTHVIRAGLETARHIWPVVVQHYLKLDGAVYEPKTPHSGVLAFTYRVPFKWLNRDSSVSFTQAVRAFNERERQVNVYRTLTVGEGALAGLAVDETGWSVLTRSKQNPEHTICRVVVRLKPLRFHQLESRRPEDAPPHLLQVAKMLFQMCDADVGKSIAQLEQVAPPSAQYELKVSD